MTTRFDTEVWICDALSGITMSGGSSSPPSQQTVTQVNQIPQFEQDFAQSNQNIAASLASQPYPTYSGQLIAGMTPQQTTGMQQAGTAATAYQPDLSAAEGITAGVADNSWNPQTAQQYMSPYAQSALQPQIQALQQQQAQNQLGINSQATMHGAFGDAQNGVQQGLNNFYAGQNLNNLEQTGMNQAYNTGLSAFQNQQQQQLAAGQQFGNLAGANQTMGITGATANYNAGAQQQQLNQSQLTEAYNNFMNQVNWPTQGLNERIAALANSPYTQTNYTSLAPSNTTAQNLGSFASLAGGLGSLTTPAVNNPPVGGSSVASDSRVKKNIKRVAETKKYRFPVYEFNYIWEHDTPVHYGVMAQDVEKVLPEAVITNEQGIKFVRYDMVA